MKRLQIDVSEQAFNQLKELKGKCESASYADVTQKAYKVLDFFMNAKADGKSIIVVDKDGKETIVEML
ncbi:hypothetical protein GAP32_021 [Cronobacter phage vB_CsaM_GAP32]|uniref:Uncharacterized protein n=2 Tax=Mimasvirus TaxID=2560176 RepID=A0A1L2CU90_9CAUD|nr:hypothetical protein GAP32_021 [Cronobacter phage vB_CsaM_GAP32]YP_009594565.1 hypothetical protein FDG95_gp025 [Pectobacterium phage vB_PcaM_CBB]YP_009595118.1 hypothetical protein FDG95_gp401 [Pectobacterium phage vB_PcaM_CBB]AFC21469.1 hypothetical protein GAP32_021 [Cronobacter phage vB_CsaM_GAP32]AMM43590.1 hypothetical protein CBB_25 [Pectobacterium phage vB_PcaM_CBB]AMM44141.1 hypothetical protein CBB_578 [Pectobacterium phage vB_PcaM_CBB]